METQTFFIGCSDQSNIVESNIKVNFSRLIRQYVLVKSSKVELRLIY